MTRLFKQQWFQWVCGGVIGFLVSLGAWAFNDRLSVADVLAVHTTRLDGNDRESEQTRKTLEKIDITTSNLRQDVGKIDGKLDILVRQSLKDNENSLPAFSMREEE